MHPRTAVAFLDELEKLGYSLSAHKTLADETSQRFAAGTRKLIRKGSLATDIGIRNSLVPFMAGLHAYPGEKKSVVAKRIVKVRDLALKDIAKTLAKGGKKGVLHDARLVRGLMDLGQSQHSWVDAVAHHEKPLEMGTAYKRTRKFIQSKNLGPLNLFLGGVLMNAEHIRSMGKGGLDSYRPLDNKLDRLAKTLARNWGEASRKKLIGILGKEHKIDKAAATKLVDGMMHGRAPGVVAKTLGQASRNVNFIGRGMLNNKKTTAITMLVGLGALALADKDRRKKILGAFA